MATVKDGGPAFPEVTTAAGRIEIQRGMSLRDYFAAKVLNGLYACQNWRDFDFCTIDNNSIHGSIAKHAYQLADAMLKERVK